MELARELFLRSSVYLLLALTLVSVVHLMQVVPRLVPGSSRGWRSLAGPLLSALLLTVMAVLSVKPGFRTLSDETNLLSVSQSLLNDGTVRLTTMGFRYFENFNPLDGDLPRRPLMLPFLTYLAHLVSGYRYQNAFAVNIVALFGVLVLIHAFVRSRAGSLAAVAAQLLFISHPIVLLSATSGGIDFLNAAFFYAVFAAAYAVMRKPSPETFSVMWLAMVAFAHCRYESIAVDAVLLVGLALTGHLNRGLLDRYRYLYFMTPLFLLPLVLQRIACIGDHSGASPSYPFGYDRFVENIPEWIGTLTRFERVWPYAIALTCISTLLLGALAWMRLRGRLRFTDPIPLQFTGLLAAGAFVILAVYAVYAATFASHPASARYFLIHCTLFGLIPLAFHLTRPDLMTARRLFLLSLGVFLAYHPAAVENRFLHSLTLNRETEHSIDFLRQVGTDGDLIINERPGQFTAMNHGAVDFAYANANTGEIQENLRRHLFQQILVFQRFRYDSEQPVEGQLLTAKFKLRRLQEFQITDEEYLRISRVRL